MINEIEKTFNAANTEQTYTIIRNCVITVQSRIYTVVSSAVLQAYCKIGEQIYFACGENDRAQYRKGFLQFFSDKMTSEFGKGCMVHNLRYMRQFYITYPKWHMLCIELSWSHYQILMVNPPIGIVLCADKSDAIVKYTLPEDNRQVFAAKYMTCIPSEEEFKWELNLNDFKKLDDRV